MTRDLNAIGVRHSPLSDSIYLCRFGKDPRVALDRRDIEPEVMQAITDHMMLDSPNGSKKTYKIDGQRYEIQVRPVMENSNDS